MARFIVSSVDFGSMNKGMASLAVSLKKELAEEVSRTKVTANIVARVCNSINRSWPFAEHVPSGRIPYLIDLIKTEKTKKRIVGTSSTLSFNLGDSKNLETKTKIATLDRKLPLHHLASERGNPRKGKAQTSKTGSVSLFRLIEEKRNKQQYPIVAVKKPTLAFTITDNQWRYPVRVMWSGSRVIDSRRYGHFTTLMKTWHKEDQREFYIALETSIHRLIRKSKFRKCHRCTGK